MSRTCNAHKIVADVALTAKGRWLLVRYRDTRKYDGQRGWFLPDDFVAFGEHPEEAAKRILRAQLGIEPPRLRLSHVESFTGGSHDAWHLIFHYVARAGAVRRIRAGDNVAQARWFSGDRMPPRSDIAHHGWAVQVLQEIRKSL